MDDDCQHFRGTVLSVRGSVVDARFSGGLPEFHSELRAGVDREIVIEVVSHVDPETVRGVALSPTAGLARGTPIYNLGHTLRVPVGERMLGRVVNVFGDSIDAGDPTRAAREQRGTVDRTETSAPGTRSADESYLPSTAHCRPGCTPRARC